MINKEKQKKRQMQEDRKSRQKSASLKPVKSVKSNKTLIRNALQHVCLAGTVNEAVKQQDLEESDASHFIILFRDTNNFLFRGLYFWDPTLDQTVKLDGVLQV
ncbi:PRC-barrel-containing protein-like protein [Gorgonomyces haynaldii]|nr:PRC-barrel-containing protein-like protein [Gorgonomyces haynaldii]